MSRKTSIFESIANPETLTSDDLSQIYMIEQDMWSREEGLGEYLKCSSCQRIYSKQDIYKDVPKLQYQRTVYELEQLECRDIFCCTECGGNMHHVFPLEKGISELRQRYAQQATLILMRDMVGDLVGFMDGYVGNFDSVYPREFEEHYNLVGSETIKQLIVDTLGGIFPDEFFVCSSSGTTEQYMNFFHIYQLLQNFFLQFPKDMEEITGLSELHSGGPYSRIFGSLGATSIGVREKFGDKIGVSNTYSSDIYVHREFGKTCKANFSQDIRKFITSQK